MHVSEKMIFFFIQHVERGTLSHVGAKINNHFSQSLSVSLGKVLLINRTDEFAALKIMKLEGFFTSNSLEQSG